MIFGEKRKNASNVQTSIPTRKPAKMSVPSFPTFIPPSLHQLVISRTLTEEHLSTFCFTTVVRAAYYYSLGGLDVPDSRYLENKIMEYWDVRPLPIVAYLRDPYTRKREECVLFPHQLEVLKWMRNREDSGGELCGIMGGIIAIAMGLGKTLIAISHSILTPQSNPLSPSPTLIITTKTLISEWKTIGFEKFFGARVKVLYLHTDYSSSAVIGSLNSEVVSTYDFVVTTYDVCKMSYKSGRRIDYSHSGEKKRARSDGGEIKDEACGIHILHIFPWERVFCDESQTFANDKTQTFKSVVGIPARKGRWCLSGTVIRNCSGDLWSQLRFCGFRHSGAQSSVDWELNYSRILGSYPIMDAICRMSNDSLSFDLPPRHDATEYIEPSSSVSHLYELLSNETIRTVCHMKNGVGSQSTSIALLSKLRQMLIAPYLLHPSSKRNPKKPVTVCGPRGANATLASILDQWGEWLGDKDGKAGVKSPKIRYVTDKVSQMEPGDKLLIFSMFTCALDLVNYAIQKVNGYLPYQVRAKKPHHQAHQTPDEGAKYIVQVDGSVVGQDRAAAIDAFKKNPDVSIMVINGRVGSEGLNLTVANKTILLEPCWTPTITEQAVCRSHRVGQTRDVYVYRPVMRVKVEENMLRICERKGQLIHEIMNRDLTKKDLVSTIGVGTMNEIFDLE